MQYIKFNYLSTAIFLISIINILFHQQLKLFSKKINFLNKKSSYLLLILEYIFYFFGEIELIFLLWGIPLFLMSIFFYNITDIYNVLLKNISYTEPIFIILIMSIVSTKPILNFVENIIFYISYKKNYSIALYWFAILTITPLLGSLITEPAAMTIAANLLQKNFFILNPTEKLTYATISLLFVNISVGGSLTNFAAPPILMIAKPWKWSLYYTFINFGVKALLGILISNILYYIINIKEFGLLNNKIKKYYTINKYNQSSTIPYIITIINCLFLLFSIINMHYPTRMLLILILFWIYCKNTKKYNTTIDYKTPLLTSCFLFGLMIHGNLQQWWIKNILSFNSRIIIFLISMVLTTFNDNAAVTFLASKIPIFINNKKLQNAVVAGAINGGGLTIIANAPNTAGKKILESNLNKKHLSPIKLFIFSCIPTLILSILHI